MNGFDVSEADEAATSKVRALANLRAQVERSETQGVIAMYERAAWRAGATVAETDVVLTEARGDARLRKTDPDLGSELKKLAWLHGRRIR